MQFQQFQSIVFGVLYFLRRIFRAICSDGISGEYSIRQALQAFTTAVSSHAHLSFLS